MLLKANGIATVFLFIIITLLFVATPSKGYYDEDNDDGSDGNDGDDMKSSVSPVEIEQPPPPVSDEIFLKSIVDGIDELYNDLYNITDRQQRQKFLCNFWEKKDVRFTGEFVLRQFELGLMKNEFNTIELQKIKNELWDCSPGNYGKTIYDLIESIDFPVAINATTLLNIFKVDSIGVRILEFYYLLEIYIDKVSTNRNDTIFIQLIDEIKEIKLNDEYQNNSEKYEIYLQGLIKFYPDAIRFKDLNGVSMIVNAHNQPLHTHKHRHPTKYDYLFEILKDNGLEFTERWLFEFYSNNCFYLKDILFNEFMMAEDVKDEITKLREVDFLNKDNTNLDAFKWKLEYDSEYKLCFIRNVKYNELMVLIYSDSHDVPIFTITQDGIEGPDKKQLLWYTSYCNENMTSIDG